MQNENLSKTLIFVKSSKIMKVGILGGGQLGRMLLQAAANYDVTTYVLENDPHCPAAHLCHHFTLGDIQNYDQVYAFGKQLDAITIEIEAVNVDALEQLEKEGVKVYPTPAAIRTIKNKILQKQFYQAHEIPTAAFYITNQQSDILDHVAFLPAVHKLGEGGYDGKGVQVINTASDVELGFNAPSVLEKKVRIAKEIAIIVGMNDKKETIFYPPAEMIFDSVYNLLDYQLSPAKIEEKQREEEAAKYSDDRKGQIGTGNRSEKIRTYNILQDRITDHRIKESWHNIEKIMEW